MIRSFLIKLLPILIFTFLLTLVIYFIEPPRSWASATYLQIFQFFTPFIGLITFITNLFFNYLPKAFITALGVFMLATLQAVGILDVVNTTAVLLITLLMVRIFPKKKYPFKFRLTKGQKIPKLHLNNK